MLLSKLNKNRGLIAASLLLMFLIALSSCSASKYGKLESRKEVQQTFKSHQVLPNHTYYYRGAFSSPIVIVGINQNYEMNLKNWVKIDTDSKDFATLVDRIGFQGGGSQIQPWGSVILDREGNQVGVWYSAARAAAVEINENRQIVNLSPTGLVGIGEQR